MNYVFTNHGESHGAAAIRNLLSLREVVTLADVPEKRVRKDIETGVLAEPRIVRLADSRLAFNWMYVLFVAAVYGNNHLNGRLRKVALSKLDKLAPSIEIYGCESLKARDVSALWLHKDAKPSNILSVDIDNYVSLNLDRVFHKVSPRMSVYCAGLSRCEENKDVLGGEAVFRGTRLSVLHIGGMADSGEPIENILEDYPYLNENDVRFASLYYRAHPTVGRPRASGEAGDAKVTAG